MNDKSKSDEEYPDRYIGDGSEVGSVDAADDRLKTIICKRCGGLREGHDGGNMPNCLSCGYPDIWTTEPPKKAGWYWTVYLAARPSVPDVLNPRWYEAGEDTNRKRWPVPIYGPRDECLKLVFYKKGAEVLAAPDAFGEEECAFLIDRLTEERDDARATATRYMEEAERAKSLLSPLRKIAERMDGQDNRATADPVFVVQQRRRIYGIDPSWTDNAVWLYEGDVVATDPVELEAFLLKNDPDDDDGVEVFDIVKTGYNDIYEFVQPFFSMKAAENYIETNRHRLTDPKVYVDTAYRNEEWQAVRGVLLGMVEKSNADHHFEVSEDEDRLAATGSVHVTGHIDLCWKCGEENKFDRPKEMSVKEFMDVMCGPGRKCPKCGAGYDDDPEMLFYRLQQKE